MFVERQCTVESDIDNFDIGGDGNRAASDFDTGQRRKSAWSLPSAEDDGIGLVKVKGKAIKTEPSVKTGETLFKFLDIEW